MARPRRTPLSIAEPLRKLESQLLVPPGMPLDQFISAESGVPQSTYHGLRAKDPKRRTSPTAAQQFQLAKFYRVPVTEIAGDAQLAFYEREGIQLRLCGDARLASQRELYEAALGMVLGDSRKEISDRIHAVRGNPRGALAVPEEDVIRMAHAGLAFGLVQLVGTQSREELRDQELETELRAALSRCYPHHRDIGPVQVVRNLTDPDFRQDPIAPFLIAYVAHALIEKFLHDNKGAFTLGLGGGLHVDTFVRTVDATSSPFPELPGSDRRFTIVPLTLEPFTEHKFRLADALVGELDSRAGSLIGPHRVESLTFTPFGFLAQRQVKPLEPNSIQNVRSHYQKLDIAIFGCGNREDDGWIQNVLQDLGVDSELVPETDVCMNMISDKAEAIALPPSDDGGRREFLGVNFREIRGIAAAPNKLGLLLTSGKGKGRALSLVAQAGYANAIVCDQAAARAALDALRSA